MRRWLAFGLILVAVGVGAYWAGQNTAGRNAGSAIPNSPDAPASAERIMLSGVVRTANSVEVLPDTSGTLQSLHVRKGDLVKEGDLLAIVRNDAFEAIEQRLAREHQSLLARLEDTEKSLARARLEAVRLKSDVESSASRLRLVQQEAERQRLLHEQGATARQKYEQAQVDRETAERQHLALEQVLQTAESQVLTQEQSLGIDRFALTDKKAEWEAAKGDVGLGEVFAPVEGVVTEIRAAEGADVGPNAEPLMEIAPVDAVRYAVVEPNEAQMRRIRVGQSAQVRPQTLTDLRELPGTVTGFRGAEVLVEFIDEGNRVPPGSQVQVEIDTTGEEMALRRP
ncbi:MAG: HlyD family efflux transporter periplasmic adaptor subunit [Bryobacterales bacterium]|nr:HlyD family efflux transporter periplasmic adaptor subunit [Bryobacterales bacterium]